MRMRCGGQTRTIWLLTFAVVFLATLPMQSIPFLRDVAASSTLASDMPMIFMDPSNITSNVGDTFTVSVKVFNLSAGFYLADEEWVEGEPLPPPGESYNYSLGNLYGFDIRLSWDPTILEYGNCSVKTPVEDHPGGILHQPIVPLFETVDAEEGTYLLVQLSLPPAAPFNAPDENATLFTMTFHVKKQGRCLLNLTNHELLAFTEPEQGEGEPLKSLSIPHWVKNGQFQTSELLTRIGSIEVGSLVTGELLDPVIQGENVTIWVNMKNDGSTDDTYNLSIYDGTTLLMKWENEVLEPGMSKMLSHMFTGQDIGIRTVTAGVTILHASEVRTDEMSRSFRVICPPTLQISGPGLAMGGQTVSYNASGSFHEDPNGQILNYTWTLWGPGETLPRDTQSGACVNFTLPASATGAWTVMLVVADNYGITAEAPPGTVLSPTSGLRRPATVSFQRCLLLNVEEHARAILVLQPENKTYPTDLVSLAFVVGREASWMGYCLDGNANVTISGNATLPNLANGLHSLVIYARDSAGNTWSSSTRYFTVDVAEFEPFSTGIVTATVVIAIAASLGAAYMLKSRRGKETTRP